MPPRRGRGRTIRQTVEESRASESDEDVQQSVPLRLRARQAEVEVEDVTRNIGEMELVLARFQRMNSYFHWSRMWFDGTFSRVCLCVFELDRQRLRLKM
ncbi:hypothetical protein F511_04129 [Dorcoceras hygrometricum]|nr:hypothetical protein F511_04129 [Dorcoceras hygrometricum]